jgi:hypothetical protein
VIGGLDSRDDAMCEDEFPIVHPPDLSRMSRILLGIQGVAHFFTCVDIWATPSPAITVLLRLPEVIVNLKGQSRIVGSARSPPQYLHSRASLPISIHLKLGTLHEGRQHFRVNIVNPKQSIQSRTPRPTCYTSAWTFWV